MSIERRTNIIAELETKLKSRIICYLTGDRPGGMETQIGGDVVPRFRRHLESIGDVEAITLFIYSRGGDTNTPWRLVNLIREYCREFNVVIPFRAHSAATLLALGADKIIMGKMSELSSIDPSVANQFNPPDPMNPAARVPISVEDVNAYRDLARRFGVKDDDADIFLAMASKVDPLALGNVERSYNQIRKLASDMLHLHTGGDEGKVTKIVEILTEELYSHVHLINRREASKMGLSVDVADKDLDTTQWALFSEYAGEMQLDQPFNAPLLLGNRPSLKVELKRAFIESRDLTDTYLTEGTVSRPAAGAVQLPPGIQLPPGMQGIQVAFQIESDGWKVTR